MILECEADETIKGQISTLAEKYAAHQQQMGP